jgi:hypothetical protein
VVQAQDGWSRVLQQHPQLLQRVQVMQAEQQQLAAEATEASKELEAVRAERDMLHHMHGGGDWMPQVCASSPDAMTTTLFC